MRLKKRVKAGRKIHNPPPVDGMIYAGFGETVDRLLAELDQVIRMNARKYAPNNEQIQLTTYYWGINAAITKLGMMAGNSEQGATLHKCESDDHNEE